MHIGIVRLDKGDAVISDIAYLFLGTARFLYRIDLLPSVSCYKWFLNVV